MTLIEYIKQNYKNPNKQILKALGASDELITYLFKTPWNTNINVINYMLEEVNENDEENNNENEVIATVGIAIVGTSTVG